MYEKFLCETVRRVLQRHSQVHLSHTTCCSGCKALVRLVGPCKAFESWYCPVCGQQLPYTFWEIKHDNTRHESSSLDAGKLIQGLAHGACAECGEGGQTPCRCQRVENAKQAERDRVFWIKWYATPFTERKDLVIPDDLTPEVTRMVKELQEKYRRNDPRPE